MKNQFTPEDIDDRCRKRFDLYAKSACKKALAYIWRQHYRLQEKEVCASPFSDYADTVACEDPGFLNPETEVLKIHGYAVLLGSDLVDLLETLPEPNRVALILTEAQCLPIKTVAEILGVSERTVKTYKRNAILILREELSGNGKL